MFLTIARYRINREQTKPPCACKIKQHLPTCRLSIVTQYFTDDCTWLQTSNTHEIDGCLGMAAALQGTTRLRPKREDVPGTHQVFRPGGGINQGADSDRPVTC